jgi:hypothetical protein
MTLSTRTISWSRILVEGVVIVVSILLAFGIDAWWDGRQRREVEHEIRDQLADEFRAVQATLLGDLEVHAQHRDRVGVLLNLANSSEKGSLNSEDFLDAFLGFTSTYLETGTLDGVLTSGQLSLIMDAELRRMLAAWPSAEEEFAEEWHYVDGEVAMIRPFVGGEVDYASVAHEVMPDVHAVSNADRFETTALAFLRTRRARNFLVDRAESEERILREGQALADLATRIQTRIEAARESRDGR